MGNAQIKLMFPSHEMPFVIPYCSASDLKVKIDGILKDMEKGGVVVRESRGLGLPNGLVLNPPSPGDWVLVDITETEIIHNSCMAKIKSEHTYMILPMRASTISKESLQEAIKVMDSNRKEMGGPPKYTAI